jgi:hypothetical protein
VARTDAAGDDQAEYDFANNRVVFRIGTGANSTNGGVVNTSTSGNVQFEVLMASSCNVLTCASSVRNTASINYLGQTSGAALYDSSGVLASGCITPGPRVVTAVGGCSVPRDTLLVNRCPATSLLIPWRQYIGYNIYSAQPFIPANLYNPLTPVTSTRVYWAYYTNGAGCADTARINMIITACPDIDDDNDGIPDYVEFNNVLATQDANSNGTPNWNDATYAGYVNNNADNVNDNFDWGADSDNDGIPNFRDTNFWIVFVDVNGDGVNDRSDVDLDGTPNQFDLDSDNDGIPDVAEATGVDANGDGRIDNYTDSDNDGFSQNVDASGGGVNGSGNGLTAFGYDTDGIPNAYDLDSDNDGIPDVVEAGGADADNDGKLDGHVDIDGDGFSDNVDGDVGNDGVAENSANALMRTGPDVSPVNGRADNYPYKNFDNDLRANPYDVDSDMDGIIDVIEAGYLDSNTDGFIDGSIGTDGWSTVVNALASLGLRNTDGRGNPDYMDIDSDDDGIPDNVEGQTTAGYLLPVYVDVDGDGLDLSYDVTPAAYGGRGVSPANKDMDALPDYMDLDTDSDGQPDIVEGNDFNLNTFLDDNVALTFLDTDGDGLDNRFDSLTSTTNVRGTSYRMGNGGSFTGDANPGTRSPVQRTNAAQTDRDWRSVGYVLDFQLLGFTAVAHNNISTLNWSIITPLALDRFEVERSTDNVSFIRINTLEGSIPLNTIQQFAMNDDIVNINSEIIYYRIKIISKTGSVKYSEVAAVKKAISKFVPVVFPNPANDKVTLRFSSDKDEEATIRLYDKTGRSVLSTKTNAHKGVNEIVINDLSQLSAGVYALQFTLGGETQTVKLIIRNNK